MNCSFLYLLMVGCNQLYVVLAQIVRPLFFLNEKEKADIKNSLQRENFSAVTAFLRRNNYEVKEFQDGSPPLVMEGDIAIAVDDIVADALEGRTSNLKTAEHLWKIGDATPHVHYFLDSKSKPDADKVHKAVKQWVDNTCIRFTELPRASCKKKSAQAAVCVMGHPSVGCWSLVGRVSRPKQAAQKLSVPGACLLNAAIHEFGHALGLYHMQSRSDREHFISVHPENMKVDVRSKNFQAHFKTQWSQASCTGRENEFDLPAPYDFMSVMHYDYATFTDADKRASYLARDVRHQHILMYAYRSRYYQSHYDLFIINTAYGCVKNWIKLCQANGKKAPKCDNLGYVGKSCKCKCPPAFSGPTCKKKVRDLFPPLPKAKVQVKVTQPKIVGFKESQFTSQPPERHDDWFNKHMQFITVVIRGKNNTYAAAYVEMDPKVISPLWSNSKFYMSGIGSFSETGLNSFILLWGTLRSGLMRAEYTSSFIRNERNGSWLRSRSSELDLVSRSALSSWFEDCGLWSLIKDCGEKMSILSYVSLKLHVRFEPRADRHLKVQECRQAPLCGRPAGLGAAMSAAGIGSPALLLAIAGAVGALVLLLVVAGVWCYARRKRQRDDSDEDSDDDEDEKSKTAKASSDSSDTSSDE